MPTHPTSWITILKLSFPSASGSSKLTLFLRFPHQNPVYTSPLPHTRYMPRPSHSSLFDRPNSIGTLDNTVWRTLFWKRLWICRKTYCRLTEWMNLNTETCYPGGRLFSSSHHVKVLSCRFKRQTNVLHRHVSKLTVNTHGHFIWCHVPYAVIIRRHWEMPWTLFLNRLLILADTTSCQHVTV